MKQYLDANDDKNINPLWLLFSILNSNPKHTFERIQYNHPSVREYWQFHCASPKLLQTRNLNWNAYKLIVSIRMNTAATVFKWGSATV